MTNRTAARPGDDEGRHVADVALLGVKRRQRLGFAAAAGDPKQP